MPQSSIIPYQFSGSWEKTWLRGRLFAVDPKNLNQVILAEGKKLNTSKPKEYSSYSTSRVLAEIAIFVALATALSFIIIFQLPEGGSVTLGSMVPMLWLSLRRGPKIGITAGVLYGFIQFVVMPYAYNPLQVLLDYPLAFGCLGLAGFFQKRPLAGVIVAISGRFVMHFISGVVFINLFVPSLAPLVNPFVYSSTYNASYLLPEMVISVVIIFLLQKSKVLRAYM
jgi:thiamine transporter